MSAAGGRSLNSTLRCGHAASHVKQSTFFCFEREREREGKKKCEKKKSSTSTSSTKKKKVKKRTAGGVVGEVGRVRAQRAPLGLHPFGGLLRPPFKAVVGGAVARADALARPQLRERELGEERVLPADRAQVPAPQPVLEAKDGRADHGSRRDEQEQPGRQRRVVAQLPDALPDEDDEEEGVEEPRPPLFDRVPRPLLQRRLVDHLPPLLRDLAEEHKGADGAAPDAAEEGVNDERAGPPPRENVFLKQKKVVSFFFSFRSLKLSLAPPPPPLSLSKKKKKTRGRKNSGRTNKTHQHQNRFSPKLCALSCGPRNRYATYKT